MKPFIYNFLEKRSEDFSKVMGLIEYSKELNLSVFKGTDVPAIRLNEMGTITFTKAENDEGSDSDNNYNFSSVGTMTITRAQLEGSDSDLHRNLNMQLGTNTMTLVSHEGSDSDANRDLLNMLSTRTLTEAREDTDSDK